MCRFCNGAESIRAIPHIEELEDYNHWRLPHQQRSKREIMPKVCIVKRDGHYYPLMYKKPFSYCPYCGRKLQEERK